MVSNQNQPRYLKQRLQGWVQGTWPGSLGSCVAGSVFIEKAIFEVGASVIKASCPALAEKGRERGREEKREGGQTQL